MTDVSTLPTLSAVRTMPASDIFQVPKISGKLFERGPNHQSSDWVPIRLIASVAISPRIVKLGLS